MSGSLKRAGAFFLLATAATVLSPGCAKDESSLFIRACLAVPTDTCEVNPDPTAEFHSFGVLDTAFGSADKNNRLIPRAYSCPLLIGNQLVARGDPARLRTETSRIQIYGADVTVTDAADAVLTRADGSASQFFTATSGFVDPEVSDQPGYGVAEVEMIDPALALDLRHESLKTGVEQMVVAHVVLHGRTLGGNEVTSGEWRFPIRVCVGCLCDMGPCNAGSSDMAAANCHVGLDAPVDCRLGVTGCPACDPMVTPNCPQ